MLDMAMLQQLLNTVGDMLPKYLQSLEDDFEKEHGTITEEQKVVFEFVQKKAKEFVTQFNPLG